MKGNWGNYHMRLLKYLNIALCMGCMFTLAACTNSLSNANENMTMNTDNIFKLKNTNIASGIYYNGRIYWEAEEYAEQVEQVSGTQIGSLQSCADEYYFPTTDFMGTNDLKPYIGTSIVQNGQMLYIMVNDDLRVFRYIDEMELGSEQKDPPSNDADGIPPPHVVYQDMIYLTYDELDNEIPQCFENVGAISEVYFMANKNFTGSIELGSELYATSFQNRYMIAKQPHSGTYYVYENYGYRSEAEK